MASPNILFYSVLKGIVKFTPDGGAERDLGNAPQVQLAPEVDKLDHFSSRAGVASKDRSVVRQKTLTLNMTLDEITAENLRMALLGSAITTNSDGNKEFGIFAESEIKGKITFTGQNDIGNKVNLTLPSVSFGPTGTLDFISEEWAEIELTGDVLFVEALNDFGTCEVIEVEEASA